MAVREDRGRQVVEFTQGGKRVFKRCPQGVTKAQAKELEVRLRRELFNRQDLGHKEDLTLEGAIGLWLQENKRKNQKQAVSEAKQWEPFLKGRLLRESPEVAAEAVHRWAQLRSISATTAEARPRRASTINRRLMLLKAVCKWAWKKGHIPENLSGRIETLREPGHKEIFLTHTQVSALADASPSASCKAAIWLLTYTGLRASELLSLTKVNGSVLTVEPGKTGRPRSVPLPQAARAHLRALPLGISYWDLRKQFIAARKKAKLPAIVTLHTLRHTCASWLINAGVDLYTVGKILGHSSPQTTQRYAHLATATLEKAMRRLK